MNSKTAQTLAKIIARMERAVSYCHGLSFDAFEDNPMLQEACVFNLLQIGELAHRGLDSEFVAAHPAVPWRQIYGMRNRIVHDYDGVRLQIVWQTITEDFPPLIACFQKCMPHPHGESGPKRPLQM